MKSLLNYSAVFQTLFGPKLLSKLSNGHARVATVVDRRLLQKILQIEEQPHPHTPNNATDVQGAAEAPQVKQKGLDAPNPAALQTEIRPKL